MESTQNARKGIVDTAYANWKRMDKPTKAFVGMCLGGVLLGTYGMGRAVEAEEQNIVRQNPLELTCEQLSERGFEARGADGNTYKIVCEDYKIPATQERGE